jgi:hypothetical protein
MMKGKSCKFFSLFEMGGKIVSAFNAERKKNWAKTNKN